jgi:hypothetical protein
VILDLETGAGTAVATAPVSSETRIATSRPVAGTFTFKSTSFEAPDSLLFFISFAVIILI